MRFFYPFSAAFLIFCGGHIYVGARAMAYLRLSVPLAQGFLAWLLYAFIAFSYFIGMYLGGSLMGSLCRLIGGYWLIAFVYMLIGFAAADIALLAIRLIAPAPVWQTVRSFMKMAGVIILSCSLALVVYGSFHARRIATARYKIGSVRLAGVSAGESLRIGLISDLHIGASVDLKWLTNIVNSLNEGAPDIVVIAGDIFDNNLSAIEDLRLYSDVLKKIGAKYGVYAVLGNHDVDRVSFRAASNDASPASVSSAGGGIRAFFNDCGVRLLEDETLLIDGRFYIAGRKDAAPIGARDHSRLSEDALLAGWDKALPLILVNHRPEGIAEAVDRGVDLLLAGHTHRGQIFPARYITRAMFDLDYGYKRIGDTHVVVSSGAGLWGPPVRVGTDSEVVLIDYEW